MTAEIGAERALERLRTFLRERRPVRSGLAELRTSIDLVGDACPIDEMSSPPVSCRDLDGMPLYRAAAAEPGTRRTILYLHGGGYIAGSWKSHGGFARRVASACAADLHLPEYRRAPEHPFPAALDDALAAYRFLLSEGVAAETMMLAGDSAGGGLALATAKAIREAGLPAPAALWLLSPWADLRPRDRIDRGDPVLRPGDLVSAASLYAGGIAPESPRLSPAIGDLAGLPPMLIQAGEIEILCDEARALAEAVEAAGGAATLSIAPAMVHVWPMFPTFFPAASDAAVDQAATFFRARTGR